MRFLRAAWRDFRLGRSRRGLFLRSGRAGKMGTGPAVIALSFLPSGKLQQKPIKWIIAIEMSVCLHEWTTLSRL